MSAAKQFALEASGPPAPCGYPHCVLEAFHDGEHQIAVEIIEKHFQEAGILTRRKGGDLLVRCGDATFEYLTGDRAAYFAPLLCRCPQREHPHELSVHNLIRYEWWKRELRNSWPWSLMLSSREEPSTERKMA